jgi:hypothetical protein
MRWKYASLLPDYLTRAILAISAVRIAVVAGGVLKAGELRSRL